jgi:Ca-activated chloride channel family protein
MKPAAIALWSLLGVAVSSAGAFAIPVSPANHAEFDPGTTIVSPPDDGDMSHFSGGQTLVLDARVGHKALPPTGGETFVFASVAGSTKDEGRALAAPLNLGIVIDRSGSMKGQRIANALAAATGTIDRMRDGDTVSVVSFDNTSQVVVPPTRLSGDTRARVQSAIQSIRLGGDTCISCGLETAMQELTSSLGSGSSAPITRMLLLSDGAANVGVRDVSGLRSIAGRMRDRGCTISTIGVDVDFDEKIMSAIATESNGRHYFVANASELASVFQQEFETLLATVARDAELEIELAPGVEPVQVFDRASRRSGQRITVPFGTFSARQEKTVLLKVRVPESFARGEATQPVARLRLAYQDTEKFGREETQGALAVRTSSRASLDDLDPFVSARLARSLTALSLTDANRLFEEGRVDEARARLSRQAGELSRVEARAKMVAPSAAAPVTAARPLADDFDQQLAAVRDAERSFGAAASGAAPGAPAPSERREGKAQVRTNQANAQALGF